MTENTAIPLKYPGLALNKCIQGEAHPLTMSAIDTLIDQFYGDKGMRATHLFVSRSGEYDLKAAGGARLQADYQDLSECYLFRYCGLYVVMLPALPDAVFLVGILDSEVSL